MDCSNRSGLGRAAWLLLVKGGYGRSKQSLIYPDYSTDRLSVLSSIMQAVNAAFSQMLSQILYTQVELRPFVLKALKVLVESNVAIASQDQARLENLPAAVRADTISQEQAVENVGFLRNQAESWLAVLFNVFGSADREARGMVGEVIAAWLSIAGDSVRFPLVPVPL